jgi:uncharacterized membrane protein
VLRLADREAARIVALIFVIWPDVVFEASNARPYALATAVTVGATWALVRWFDRGTNWSLALYVVLAAAMPYCHLLFGLALPAHLLYAVARSRETDPRVASRRIWFVFTAVAFLDLGLIPQLWALWSRRSALQLESILSVDWLSTLFVPAAVVVGIVIGCVIAMWAGHHVSVRVPSVARSTVILVLAGMLIPLLTLAALALFTSVVLVETRYTMAAAPFAAMFTAGLVWAIEPRQARWFVCVCLALISIIGFTQPSKHMDEWRWASQRSNQISDANTAVFIRAGLVESSDTTWFADPERAAYLMSPVSYYHFDGDVLPLPFILTDETKVFIDDELNALPPSIGRVVVIVAALGVPTDTYIEGRLEAQGWTHASTRSVGQTNVDEWTRPAT